MGSATVTASSMSMNGAEIAFSVVGAPDGAPVYAFHGTPGSRHQLMAAGPVAGRLGLALVVPDRPGYGESPFQPMDAVADWAPRVAHLADRLGHDRFAVLGVSGGGPFAVACAAAIPARVSAVSVVSSPAPVSIPSVARSLGRFARMAVRHRRVASASLRAFSEVAVVALRRWPELTLEVLARRLPAGDRAVLDDRGFRRLAVEEAEAASRNTARAMAQELRCFAHSWGVDLDDVAAPVTIWHGTEDPIVTPTHAVALAAHLRDAQLRLVPGGHLVFAQHMGSVMQLLKQ